MTKGLSRWLPVLLWMGLIFLFSAQSSLPQIGTPPVRFLLSKTAHFLEYLVLALLLVRAQGTLAEHRRRAYAIALLVVIAYAASDEFHQSLVPHRTASPWDVTLDSVGAVVGLIILGRRGKSAKRDRGG